MPALISAFGREGERRDAMASAALRGDVVYARDLDDLGRLQRDLPSVRLIGI